MSETELTPEHRAMVALLVAMKVPDPRGGRPSRARRWRRVSERRFIPALRTLAESVAGLVDTFDRVIGSAGAALADEAERIANS